MEGSLTQTFFLIFTGAAILASLALYTRQPLLVAYIAIGALLGPHGFELINNVALIEQLSRVGIIFLLFLLGLDMQPKALISVIKQATPIAAVSSALFFGIGYGIATLFSFSPIESVVIGMSMMFSSTIIGIKLLPTTVLHHKRTGEMMIGLLLLQDFIAILCLMFLLSGNSGNIDAGKFGLTIIALPLIILFAWLCVKFIIVPLLAAFDRYNEYTFLLALGWCLGMSELAEYLGLSSEIGAFIGGISLATSPISQYIAENLKPLRDFFLIMFFFSLGASFNLALLPTVIVAASLLAITMLITKPVCFRFLLSRHHENKALSWDIGLRLGQISEFSLLISVIAIKASLISEKASTLIQATAIITFLISSYIVIFNLPNPIAVKDRLRRD